MARVNLEDCWWTDPRRAALQRMGLDADGVAIRAWKLAQDFWKHSRAMVPKSLFDTLEGAEKMIQVGLADVRDSFVYVRGSSAYLDWIHEKREQAKAAGKKSAEARRAKVGTAQPKPRTKPERPSNDSSTKRNDAEPSYSYSSSSSVSDSFSDSELIAEGSKNKSAGEGGAPSSLVWAAYAEAYEGRYHVTPVRNVTVNAQIKSFVGRVGAEEAPKIAAFYLSHADWYYVKNRHPVGAMLRDAEKLRTEWATGVKSTQAEAKSAEKNQGYQSQLERIARGDL